MKNKSKIKKINIKSNNLLSKEQNNLFLNLKIRKIKTIKCIKPKILEPKNFEKYKLVKNLNKFIC